MRFVKNTALLVIFTAIVNYAQAQIVDSYYKNIQPYDNSAISRLGFGNLLSQYFANTVGSAGMTAATRDIYNFNPYNPASLPGLRTTAFEIGLSARISTEKDVTGASSSALSGNLSYVGLGFPTYSVINEILDRKPRDWRWGFGLSLTPFNQVGYNVAQTVAASNTDSVTIANFYVGSGGSYKAFISNGVEYKNFSLGINVGVLFGKTSFIRQTVLSDSLISPYNNYFIDDYSMTGFIYSIGAQYDIILEDKKLGGIQVGKKRLVLGVYGNPSTSFSTSSSQFYRRLVNGFRSDTLANNSNITGSGKLPSEVTAGFQFKNGYTFQLGGEVKYTAWSQYQNDARPDNTLKNSIQYSIGTEFILDKNRLKSDEEKVRYSLGTRFGTDPRTINSEQFSSLVFTGGFCFPIRVGRGQQLSFLNLGLEYGKLSTTVLTESYFKATLGFTLNDNTWFLKRKYN